MDKKISDEDMKFLIKEPDFRKNFEQNESLHMFCKWNVEKALDKVKEVKFELESALQYLEDIRFEF